MRDEAVGSYERQGMRPAGDNADQWPNPSVDGVVGCMREVVATLKDFAKRKNEELENIAHEQQSRAHDLIDKLPTGVPEDLQGLIDSIHSTMVEFDDELDNGRYMAARGYLLKIKNQISNFNNERSKLGSADSKTASP